MSIVSRPLPTAPKLQLIKIPANVARPASGLRLSCMQLFDPLALEVVMAAQAGPAPGPKRSSFPSRLPHSDWSTGNLARPGTTRVRGPV